MKRAEIKDMMKVQLDIMIYVDSYCRRNGLRYSLYGGTLIGAVRHKGFIPWDDDIDIMMERKDYDRLVHDFNNQDSVYKLFSIEKDKKYPYPYAKIGDSRTVLKEHIYKSYPVGINIDIFPIETLPDEMSSLRRMYGYQSFFRMCLNAKLLTELKKRNIGKKLMLVLSFIILSPFPRHFFIQMMTRNATKYNKLLSNHKGDILGGYGMKEILDKHDFDNYIDLDFEGHKFMVIEGYDHYLKNVFGDYMQLPPEENRVSHHHFDAYL